MSFALCRSLPELPKNAGQMIWQQKLDGVRAFVSPDSIRLRGSLLKNTGLIVPEGCVLDGEIMSDKFFNVMPAINRQDWGSLQFVPFDVVKADGEDVRGQNLLERLVLLNSLTDNALPSFAFPGQKMPKVPKDWEGVIGKSVVSPYRSGRSWVKWKHVGYVDAVILGYEPGRGGWSDGIGKVVFGTADGTVLGKAAGFDRQTRKFLSLNGVDYIGKPCVIQHYGVNKKRLRNPIFHGIKEEIQ